jgi:hypothetical protein
LVESGTLHSTLKKEDGAVKTTDFEAWRHELGLSQQLAAKLLGVALEEVENYVREGWLLGSSATQIPELVEVRCKALTLQRRVYQAVKFLDCFRAEAGTNELVIDNGAAIRAQELRNLLFDVDVLLMFVSHVCDDQKDMKSGLATSATLDCLMQRYRRLYS